MSNFSVMMKSLLILAWLIVYGHLTGCLPSAVNMKPPITKETPVVSDGVVVAKVINLGCAVIPFNQLTVTPKGLKASKNVKSPRLLSYDDLGGGDISLFASAILPGEYSLESTRAFFAIGEYIYSSWAIGGVDFGVFKVVPGKITDLGTMICYRKVEGDKYATRLIRVPETENSDLLAHYFPFLSYSKDNVLTWQEDGLENDRQSAYVALAQNPTIFSERYLSPNGSLFMLGKLGAILERTESGTWIDHTLETNSDLNVIAQNSKGNILVGGDHGALFFKGTSDAWNDISLDVTTRIDGIKWLPSGEVVLYLAQNGIGMMFQGNPAQTKPSWKKIAFYNSYKGWQNALGEFIDIDQSVTKLKSKSKQKSKEITHKLRVVGMTNENFLGNEYIRVAIQQTGLKQDFTSLSPVKSKIFKVMENNQLVYEEKLSGKMDKIFQAGQVTIGVKIAGFWSWTGRDDYYRYDPDTNSWLDINTVINNCRTVTRGGHRCTIDGKEMRNETFTFLSRPLFMSKDEGYATAKPTYKNKDAYLLVTKDGGVSWKIVETTLPGKFCTDLIPEITDRIMLYCSGVSGDIYESIDRGKSWKHVREHQNF